MNPILAPFGLGRSKPSPRAHAIAAGLVRTGRAANLRVAGNFVRADGMGATYWVSTDGTRVLRGNMIGSADELQSGFLAAMVQAGVAVGVPPSLTPPMEIMPQTSIDDDAK